MKIILLHNVPRLGNKNDIKDVSDGYALNLLIPKGLAITATPTVLKRNELEKAKKLEQDKLEENLKTKALKDIQDKKLLIKVKADAKGSLFAGIHNEDISVELKKQFRLEIEPSSIMLEQHIKNLGEHTIQISYANKKTSFILVVEKL